MNGRNLDYGSKKSNSGEGSMAKRALLTMAKDLYNLYLALNDQDDLPEWCHYKIARSQNELEAVTNYLTSKIAKICVDQNVTHDKICEHANEAILKDIIKEGFLDSIKGIFNKGQKKSYTKSIDEIIKLIKKEGSKGGKYYHLKMIHEVIRLLVHANKSMAIFSNISARRLSQFREKSALQRQEAGFNEDAYLEPGLSIVPKEIEDAIKEILSAAIKIKNILSSVRSELRIYLEGPRYVSFKKKTNESIKREQYDSFENIKRISIHINSAMKEIKGFSKTGMTLQVAKQIKDLCGENKEAAKKLLLYFDNIINTITQYSLIFDYVQFETDYDKAKYDNRYKPTIELKRMDYENI